MRPRVALLECLLLLLATSLAAQSLDEFASRTGAQLFWEPYRQILLISDLRHRLSIDWQTQIAVKDGLNSMTLSSLTPSGSLSADDFGQLLAWWNGSAEPSPTLSPSIPRVVEPGRGPRIQVLVLDAGHGGSDPGSIGRHTIGGKEVVLEEKDLALAVVLELQKMLTQSYPDRTIVLTRNSDTYPTLERRVQIAHAQKLSDADSIFFLSVHFNASLNSKASGLEIWYVPQDYEREVLKDSAIPESALPILNTMVDQEYKKQSRDLALHLAKGLSEELGDSTVQRGLKENPWFVVRMARMPAVLAELGFITNPTEAEKLLDPEYLKKLARGLYTGLVSFIHSYEDHS